MTPWTRDNTREWIDALEGRLYDITYYLDRTLEWCDENDIEDERTIFMCCFLTCIWVSQLRGEPITYVELMEMLGVEEFESPEEKFYELDSEYVDLEHEELLTKAVEKLDGTWND